MSFRDLIQSEVVIVNYFFMYLEVARRVDLKFSHGTHTKNHYRMGCGC